ncbi:Rrf2 family transcriptional regulator [Kaistia nematophila]|uniref:Rrf2 family transcriptional regulator n=1 Tax=Kaistia nematophila TaxID=2994654 RepID=A0A9X3DZ31_9HYPH|nr:Rrf2 family transcriptional regulator [Kaistia nematophila]MCX5567983.1 Rrf2 family transcriptional regulator [Kaistia nematophila]
MRSDSRLSRMLHVLVHMQLLGGTETSDTIALMLKTNPVVVRRTMAKLKQHGIVSSEGGPGGGWRLLRAPADLTVLEVHRALTDASVFTLALSADHPACPVERAVNARLSHAMSRAEAVLAEEFGATTLADIAREFQPAG